MHKGRDDTADGEEKGMLTRYAVLKFRYLFLAAFLAIGMLGVASKIAVSAFEFGPSDCGTCIDYGGYSSVNGDGGLSDANTGGSANADTPSNNDNWGVSSNGWGGDYEEWHGYGGNVGYGDGYGNDSDYFGDEVVDYDDNGVPIYSSDSLYGMYEEIDWQEQFNADWYGAKDSDGDGSISAAEIEDAIAMSDRPNMYIDYNDNSEPGHHAVLGPDGERTYIDEYGGTLVPELLGLHYNADGEIYYEKPGDIDYLIPENKPALQYELALDDTGKAYVSYGPGGVERRYFDETGAVTIGGTKYYRGELDVVNGETMVTLTATNPRTEFTVTDGEKVPGPLPTPIAESGAPQQPEIADKKTYTIVPGGEGSKNDYLVDEKGALHEVSAVQTDEQGNSFVIVEGSRKYIHELTDGGEFGGFVLSSEPPLIAPEKNKDYNAENLSANATEIKRETQTYYVDKDGYAVVAENGQMITDPTKLPAGAEPRTINVAYVEKDGVKHYLSGGTTEIDGKILKVDDYGVKDGKEYIELVDINTITPKEAQRILNLTKDNPIYDALNGGALEAGKAMAGAGKQALESLGQILQNALGLPKNPLINAAGQATQLAAAVVNGGKPVNISTLTSAGITGGTSATSGVVDVTPRKPTNLPGNIADVFEKLYNLGIYAGSIIFMLMFLVGGLMYMTSGGDEKNAAKARMLLLNSVIGLLIVLGAWATSTFLLQKLGLTTLFGQADAPTVLVEAVTPEART